MAFPRASEAFTALGLTASVPADLCTATRAGANVIKIDALMEDAGSEQPCGRRPGSDFQSLHRKKRVRRLNLKNTSGNSIFRRLAKKVDVVVENSAPT